MKKVTVKRNGKEIVSVSATVDPVDYDKLAEAIARSIDKQNNKYSVSREWMKFIITPMLWSMGIIVGLLAIGLFIAGGGELVSFINAFQDVNTLQNVEWQKLAIAFLAICIGLFFVSVSVATILSAREIDKENDRQYVAAMFSNLVAIAALVVALVALVKG